MREEAVNVPESAVVAAAPASSERAKNDNETNANARQDATAAPVSRHASKCRICNHPDRAAIEFDFLNWRNPGDIVQAYRFRGLSTIYRHAHATGLFAKRRLNLRFAMERIVERVNEVPVTANAVIRAARAVARINDSGEWVDPPSRVIVTHIHAEDAAVVGAGLALPAPAQQANPSGGTGSVRPERSRMGQPVSSSAEPQIRGTGSQLIHSPVESRIRGTGSQPVQSSDAARLDERHPGPGEGSRDRKACLGGRGLSPDIKRRSPKPSIRARQGGEGNVPSIPAHDSSETISRPSLTFDDAFLDEPSDSASCELPRINGKPPDPEIVLEIAPSLYEAVEARREAAKVRLAPWSNPEFQRLATAAYCSGRSAQGGAGTVSPKSDGARATEGQSVAPPSSTLPEAALNSPAPSAERFTSPATLHESRNTPFSTLPEEAFDPPAPASKAPSAARGTQAATDEQPAGPSFTLLPQAASNSPATACPEQGRGTQQAPSAPNPPSQRRSGPPLGSAGSANPPFPFDPPPLRRWKPRRRF